MPRGGPPAYTYSLPAIYLAIPGTLIVATQHNTPLEDIAATLNMAWPVNLGGTGGTTAAALLAEQNEFTATQSWAKGADLASASTLTLGIDGNYFHVTGTTTITGISSKPAGTIIALEFDAALTLTHNGTSLILPGAGNITTAAGDTAIFVSEGPNAWRCLSYQRAAATPFSFSSGSYTPGLLFGGNNSGMTISAAQGRYVKIGTLVVLQFTLTLSVKGVSAGIATIPNMPFTPIATVPGSGAAFLNDGGFSGLTAGIIFHVSPGSTALGLRLPRTNGTGSVTDANFIDGAVIGGTVTYLAAS